MLAADSTGSAWAALGRALPPSRANASTLTFIDVTSRRDGLLESVGKYEAAGYIDAARGSVFRDEIGRLKRDIDRIGCFGVTSSKERVLAERFRTIDPSPEGAEWRSERAKSFQESTEVLAQKTEARLSKIAESIESAAAAGRASEARSLGHSQGLTDPPDDSSIG